MKYLLGLWILFFAVFPIANLAEPADRIKPLSGFPGYSGLWDMPNARVLPDWHMRIGSSFSPPYYYFHTTIGLFDRVELNGRVTGIRGLPALGPGYGDTKDKAIDVKLLLLKEKPLRPALAIGGTDIHGTGIYTSRYLVASKQIGLLDITLGLGQGMFGGKSSLERYEVSGKSDDRAFAYLSSTDTDFSLFGGLEYAVRENLHFTVEYSSIKHEKIKGVGKARLPLTFGLKYTLWDHIHFSAALARGEKWSAGILFQFPLEAEGILTWKKEPAPIREERILHKAARANDQQLADLLTDALKKDGFSHVRIFVLKPKLWVELENMRYNSPSLALGRAFLVVNQVAPESIKKLYLVLARNGIFQTGLAASRDHLRNFVESTTDLAGFLEFAILTQEKNDLWADFFTSESQLKEAHTKPPIWSIEVKPKLTNLLNDPSGFFKTRLSIDIIGSIYPWKGGYFITRYSIPVYNDISSSSKMIEPEPANTDYINYLSRQSAHLIAYGYDHIFDLPKTSQARLGLGAFEAAYFGLGGEVFKYFGEGRYGLGLESELVWKRNISHDFALHGEHKKAYYTYFLNLYGQPFGWTGIEVGLKIGRFLGGDKGVRFDFCRTFKHFTIGAWYTVTNTSHFIDPNNRGYKDKGVFISLSPWTRDPGRTVSQFRRLYPFGNERETISSLKNSIMGMRR
ncbi:MAG: YjbH domain-containing protein [Deltaproteobacteria bacterium]|nr:YjbH domain-containing protein [Deltaproteobacteria bacterium]